MAVLVGEACVYVVGLRPFTSTFYLLEVKVNWQASTLQDTYTPLQRHKQSHNAATRDPIALQENLCCTSHILALMDLMMVIKLTETCSPNELIQGVPGGMCQTSGGCSLC